MVVEDLFSTCQSVNGRWHGVVDVVSKYVSIDREIVSYGNRKSYSGSTRLPNRFFHFLPRIHLRTSINIYRTIEYFFLEMIRISIRKANQQSIILYLFLDSSSSYCWPWIDFTLSTSMNGIIHLQSDEDTFSQKQTFIHTLRSICIVFDPVIDPHVSTFDRAWTCNGWFWGLK